MLRKVRLVGVVLALMVGASVGIAGTARADLPPPPPPQGPWESVSAGFQHTCSINVEDSLFCWGRNGSAQTGTGAISEREGALHRVGAVGVWSQVSAGVYHTCGITKAANLYCWGNNDFSQVGDGTTVSPWLGLHRVGAAGVWSRVSAGNFYTCGITKAANLYCWGDNASGQVGDGTVASPRFSLYRVGAAGVWSRVSAGGHHTCGITKAANLYCWGRNSSGQAGDGSVASPRFSLYRVGAAGVWSGIDAGEFHTCGMTNAANLYCWGRNDFGQTGDGSVASPRLSLYRVGAAGVWSGIDAGEFHTCGITKAANLYCWGYNASGQTGDGSVASPRLSLFRVGAPGVWAGISASAGRHTCGITKAKNLYCWGNNDYSQIGDDDPISLGIFYQNPRLTLWRVR